MYMKKKGTEDVGILTQANAEGYRKEAHIA